MAGVEVLAGLGLLATEVFRYNRENYEFDQDQRFEREELRIKMQVERFALFREDIRDLVELTVGKMDLYHIVGALFIKMIVIYYCEGFFEEAAPPFLLTFYYLSAACAFVYLLMAVWLAMHASISSHSYGTRLLTRFVRLPIPGSQQMNALNARFADFERQGVQMLRVPFLDGKANTWQQRAELEEQRAKEVKAAAAGLPSSPAAMASPLRRSSESGPNIIGRRVPEGSGLAPPDSQYLQDAEHAYGGATDMAGREDELLHAVEFRTQRHVQLFRQLQARWQCYDAYARVCMSLGVRHMLQAISYYLIGICMVQNQLPYLAYVLTFTFQALAMTTSVLDIHGLPCYGTLDLSVVGMLPSIILCVSLSIAPRDQEGLLLEDNFYLSSLAAYPLEICWFELLRWVASPTDPGASLPRHFRAVLFMDVFSDVDLVEQENPDGSHLSAQERTQLGRRVATCEGALTTAKAALRRWEAVPNNWLSMKQRRQLVKFQTGFNDALEDLRDELVSRHFRWTFEDNQSWEELSSAQREEDPYANCVLGPFQHFTGMGLAREYYYDLEHNEFLWELPGPRTVFTLQEALNTLLPFQQQVAAACRVSGGSGPGGYHDLADTDSEESSPGRRSPRATSASPASHASSEEEVIIKPVRLPWQLVSGLTRAAQFIWVAVAIIAVLRETNTDIFDFQESYIVEDRRRLSALRKEPVFEQLEMGLPYGSFFRAEALACIPTFSSTGSSLSGDLIVASPFAQYRISSRNKQEAAEGAGVEAAEELSRSLAPAGAAIFCGPKGSWCLVGELTDEEGVLLVRPLNRSVGDGQALMLRLPSSTRVESNPWRRITGAIVDCSGIGSSRNEPVEPVLDEHRAWCIMVAGWTGTGLHITVAVAELPEGMASTSAAKPQQDTLVASASALPLLDLRLDQGGTSREQAMCSMHPHPAPSPRRKRRGGGGQLPKASAAPTPTGPTLAAVHLGQQGRLWALFSTGCVEAWDVLGQSPQRIQQWQAKWPAALRDVSLAQAQARSHGRQRFSPTAVCHQPSLSHGVGDLFVAGHTLADGLPVLLRLVTEITEATDVNITKSE